MLNQSKNRSSEQRQGKEKPKTSAQHILNTFQFVKLVRFYPVLSLFSSHLTKKTKEINASISYLWQIQIRNNDLLSTYKTWWAMQNGKPLPIGILKYQTTKFIKRIMYQLKVDVDKLNAMKVVLSWRFERWPFVGASTVLASTKGQCSKRQLTTTFMALSLSTSTLSWYIIRFFSTPTQIKTSSHRD